MPRALFGRSAIVTGASHALLCLPDFYENPYQVLLAQELATQGYRWVFADYGRKGLLLGPLRHHWGRCGGLHLHWLHAALRSASRAGRRLDAMRMIAEVALLRALRIPVFFTIHNLHAHESTDPRAEKALTRWMIRLCNQSFVHSPRARSRVGHELSLGPRSLERITVIEHGNYLPAYPQPAERTPARRALGLEDGQCVFLLFGYLRRNKNAADFIDALAALPDPRLRLLIVGRADDAAGEDIRRRVSGDRRMMLIERYVPDAEVPVFFAAADVAVIPYDWQLTSGALILAMGFGKPLLLARLARDESPALDGNVAADGDFGGALRYVAGLSAEQLAGIGERNAARARALSWTCSAVHLARCYAVALGDAAPAERAL